ncbi:MAG TPA: class I tRNA ligase family protein, partial [Trebonia sp.]|nr:class I tRNA ligase family protein [Trebonia sp.]
MAGEGGSGTRPGYRQMPPQVDLPALEREVLARWRERDVFARTLAQTAEGPLWTFYEGPPTANGRPGTHHVEARVFKDLFPRYRTMRGYHVPRRAGWDCHGLPVELEVEKKLGFSGKTDIEDYGIEAFNAKCRESVLEHVDAFTRMTERMGYWVDLDAAYWTMDADYIQSVWWSLKRIYEAGLLVSDHRVTPYCPRCGTGLSDHEVAQGYLDVTDPSVYVRFPVTSGPLAERGATLLVWTTTPWTLISNTAVAVNPAVTYVVARPAGSDELVVVAEPLVEHALGAGAEILDRMPGTALEHVTYSRPFDLVDIPEAHFVGLADYVTVEDGTGLVHQAPAFGADDLAVARRYGLPVVNPIEPNGHFADGLPLVGGQFFKSADPLIVVDLRERGLLYRSEDYTHSY